MSGRWLGWTTRFLPLSLGLRSLGASFSLPELQLQLVSRDEVLWSDDDDGDEGTGLSLDVVVVVLARVEPV